MKCAPVIIFSLCCLLRAALMSSGQPLPWRIPYFDGSRWGYCDSEGRVVIEPQWDSAGFFVDGRALTMLGHSAATCIINGEGGYIVPPARHWNGKWTGKSGAELNASDSAGRWGMIDTLNNELVHFEYDQPHGYKFRSGFTYVASIGKWYLFESKNGKQGVIDDHNKVMLPFKYAAVYYPFDAAPWYMYLNNGPMHTGAADTNGREVVPPQFYDVDYRELFAICGKPEHGFRIRSYYIGGAVYQLGWDYDGPCRCVYDQGYDEFYVEGPFVIFKYHGDSLFGVMDTSLRMVAAPKYASITYNPQHYFTYRLPGSRYCGILDTQLTTVLRPSYESIDFEGDSVRVTKNYSDPDEPDKYYKYLAGGTFQPTTPWLHDTAAEKQFIREQEWARKAEEQFGRGLIRGDWCGTGRAQAARIIAEERQYAWSHAHITRHRAQSANPEYDITGDVGEKIYEFDKDSLHYLIVRQVHNYPDYFCVKSRSRANDTTAYYAVVDTNLNYIAPPEAGYSVEYMNVAGRLTVVKKDSLYSFLDSNYQLAAPFQPYNIVASYHLPNAWYALGTTDTVNKTPNEIRNDQINVNFIVPRPNFDSATKCIDTRRDITRLHKKLLRDGRVVPELKDYDVVKILPAAVAGGAPSFLVRDAAGMEGIVTPDGKVLFRKISFHFSGIEPVDDRFLLVKNDSGAYYELVDASGKKIARGAKVCAVCHPSLPDLLINGRNSSILMSLYRVDFWNGKARGTFYMNRDGVVYAEGGGR